MQRHHEKLSSAERNYATIEECLVIVWGIKKFHLYLYCLPFVLQTDYEPLKYMDSAKYANTREPCPALAMKSRVSLLVTKFHTSQRCGSVEKSDKVRILSHFSPSHELLQCHSLLSSTLLRGVEVWNSLTKLGYCCSFSRVLNPLSFFT